MKATRASCKGCLYYRKLQGEYCCHYTMDTDRLRECTIDNCNKYKKKPRKGNAKGAALFG